MSETEKTTGETNAPDPAAKTRRPAKPAARRPKEVGGRKKGLDPTRYGDWEKDGRAIDF